MDIKQYISKQPTGYWRNQKGNQKISRKKWQWKHNSKPMWCIKSTLKREVYSNTILPQETRKYQIDNLTLHLKQLEKEEQNPPKLVEGKKS